MPTPLPITIARPHERGYALLLVFLMAAVVALSMFAVLPRVAFEAQRDQEQLLVDRGEQYKRAIQLFYRKLHKYPVKMEDLENTNNQRFLRDRYVDPLTGKSEWRLIHVGPGGVFTDSLTQKPNASTKQNASAPNNFIGEIKGLGDQSTQSDTDGVNVGLRRRASDPGGADLPTDPNAPPPDPNAPAGVPGINVPVQTQAANGNSSVGTSTPGTNGTNGNTGTNGQSAASNGTDLIRNLLTSPRPGGAPPGVFSSDQSGFGADSSQSSGFNSSNATNVSGNGIQGSSTPGQSIGNSAGTFATGSFAGIASTVKRPGIKIYAEHKKYNEWEFIYDYGKDPAFGGGTTMPIPNNPNGLNGNNNGNNNNGNNLNGNLNGSSGANGFGSNPNPNTGINSGINSGLGTTTTTPTPAAPLTNN